MSGQDVIVFLGDANAAPDRLGSRPRLHLENASRLSRYLADAEEASVTVCARWCELTVGVSCLLAEWAAERPERSCGVLPFDLKTRARPSRRSASPIVLLSDLSGFQAMMPEGSQDLTTDRWLDLLTSSPPPVALVITGHGGEHCISIGEHWLGTNSQAALPGSHVNPDIVRSRAVFLNTCGSLRLGDSVVPAKYSLAARLYTRGAAVVGAYRNQFTYPSAASVFARGVLSGLPLGRVLNQLNIESRKLGDPTSPYQLLGDAAEVLVDTTHIFAEPPRLDSISISGKLVKELAWLEQLYRTIGTWLEYSPKVVRAHRSFVRNLRLIFIASHRNTGASMTSAEIEGLEALARAAARQQRENLLEELTTYTLQGIWPQSLCAPVSAAPNISMLRCRRCGGRVMAYESRPLGNGLLSLRSEDCDHCGTVTDEIGRSSKSNLVQAEIRDGEIHVELPKLGAEVVGKVTVHRSGSAAPRNWPANGGIVRIPITEIPFRGKTTIAVSQLGRDFLSFNYATIFVSL